MCLLGLWFSPGPMEMLIILAIALLLFGQRLPEVAKSLGKGLNEFQKGLREVENEIHSATYGSSSSPSSSSSTSTTQAADDYEDAIAPRFEPPPASEPEADAGAVAGRSEADEQAAPNPRPDPNQTT